MKKNGQVGTVDFIVALVLFLIVIMSAVQLIVNITPDQEYDKLYRESLHTANNLLSEGVPTNWDNTTVILPGIANSNRINLTKLELFDNMTYEDTRQLYHISSNYIFYFQNKTQIINQTKCTRGYPVSTNETCEPNLDSISKNNLVKIERIVIINSTPAMMVILSWD